jgi:excisionase family DNA binding protein
MMDEDDEAITLPVLPGAVRFGPPHANAPHLQLRQLPRGREPEAIPSVLTVDELAALLRVNRKTVYDALSRGEIPGARRIGSTYRILRAAVLEWLASSQDRAARSRRNR